MRKGIDRLDDVLATIDDDTPPETDHTKLLARADETLVLAERGLVAGRRALPKVALSLALVGIGVVVAVAIRRSRAGRVAAEEHVLEQPEEPVHEQSMQDVAAATGDTDASDLADAADAVEGERG